VIHTSSCNEFSGTLAKSRLDQPILKNPQKVCHGKVVASAAKAQKGPASPGGAKLVAGRAASGMGGAPMAWESDRGEHSGAADRARDVPCEIEMLQG
jgi:hypothetical protein